MLKSLVWKEFREVLPICAMAMATQLLLFGYAVNVWRLHQPRDASSVWPLLYLTAVLLGVAVGIWQNVRDDNQGTFQFLLHRPIRRSTIFTVRLLLGAAICLIVGLMPLLFFTTWVEGINPNRETPAAEVIRGLCAGIWLLYTGAFLSVLRPGAGTVAGSCLCSLEYSFSLSSRSLLAQHSIFILSRMLTNLRCD